ncbi:MAG: HAD family phosphatase [Oscillatoria sp. SIO1A7]|nr:HAD family phosphatase [Oscillatoria sp. SIO1A7]
MAIKAVLFDFNGVIINDEPIHEQLLEQLLLEENLRPKPGDFRKLCLGRSDRASIADLFASQGRFLSEDYLSRLIERKNRAYRNQLENQEKLPIYIGVADLIYKLRVAGMKLAIVSGAIGSEIKLVLKRAELAQYFPVVVAGDDLAASKPEPDGYLLAVERLNREYPDLNLRENECLAIEDSPAGIEAAKRAGMPVVGVANTYPYHIVQRLANWAVDYLWDLEIERLDRVYGGFLAASTVRE